MAKPIATPNMSLVTGAANGLGFEIAHLILSAGGRVIAVDQDSENLQHLVDQFPQLCVAINIDLADLNAIDQIIAAVGRSTHIHGPLNLALFCAGISATGRFEKLPIDIHQKIFDLNATSPMLMAVGLMQQQIMGKGSAMVFISSLSHLTGYPGAASYAAAKDAIAIYAKSVAKKFGRHKVHVMRVFPGPIRTQMAARHSPQDAKPELRMPPKKMAQRILQAASRGEPELFPDIISRATSIFARAMPRTMTKIMRRVIFEKLHRETF